MLRFLLCCHFPQKMESICPVFSAPCGDSVWLLASLSLSRLLYDHMKSWTSNHHRQWASFPFMAWVRLSPKTSEHLSHTSFRRSKDQLFSPLRMNDNPAPLTTFRASVACPTSCTGFCRYSPPTLPAPSHCSFAPFHCPHRGGRVFFLLPSWIVLQGPIKLDWQKVNKKKTRSLLMCAVHIQWRSLNEE